MNSILPNRPSHENAHPLAGQTRRLHTTFENLHRQHFLVIDWYSRVTEVPGTTLEQLRRNFMARCQQKAEHPVIEQMDWFFDQRVIVGYLSDTGSPMLIDTDELPDLRLRMVDAHQASLNCAEMSVKNVLNAVSSLIDHHRLSAQTRASAQSVKERLNEISTLLAGDDVLVTEAGIAGLERAYALSGEVHEIMSSVQESLRQKALARKAKYHVDNGWMRHYHFYDNVGGREAYVHDDHNAEDDSYVLERVNSLLHDPGMNYSNSGGGTTLYLRDILTFASYARVTYSWLTAWESGQA